MTSKKPPKHYPLDQSPLFKLKSRKKLAALFNLDAVGLEKIADRKDNYRVFKIYGHSKTRTVESPKPILERIHRRIFHLLQRIQPPEYLHSGVAGRSYVTNAQQHLGDTRLVKLDIQAFFPSTLGWHVYEFFNQVLCCSDDVSAVLTKICTIDDHVPTGSCLSQSLAFYAHYNMFNEIHAYCNSKGLNMTCYVDDITISGNRANSYTLYEVRGMLRRRGLRSPRKKEKIYEASEAKLVTGLIIRGHSLLLPNVKHLQIHDDITNLLSYENPYERAALMPSALGKVISASLFDSGFENKLKSLKQENNRLKKLF